MVFKTLDLTQPIFTSGSPVSGSEWFRLDDCILSTTSGTSNRRLTWEWINFKRQSSSDCVSGISFFMCVNTQSCAIDITLKMYLWKGPEIIIFLTSRGGMYGLLKKKLRYEEWKLQTECCKWYTFLFLHKKCVPFWKFNLKI